MSPPPTPSANSSAKPRASGGKRGGFGGAIFLRASPAAKAGWRLPPRRADAARAAIRKVRARNPGNDEGGILIYPPGGTAHFHLQDIHIKREISAYGALLCRKALKSERRNASNAVVLRQMRVKNRRFHAAANAPLTERLKPASALARRPAGSRATAAWRSRSFV